MMSLADRISMDVSFDTRVDRETACSRFLDDVSVLTLASDNAHEMLMTVVQ